MSASALEGEDLDNVRLVRMEDVQPSREGRIEIFETCIIDHIEYDNECVIGDDQTNVGGIVSIQTDETEQSASEFIVPEILEVPVVSIMITSCVYYLYIYITAVSIKPSSTFFD